MSSRSNNEKILSEFDVILRSLNNLTDEKKLEIVAQCILCNSNNNKTDRILEEYKSIERGEFDIDHEIRFSLNFDLAQCKSKTKLSLKYIGVNHKQNQQSLKLKNTKKKRKLITIVFTNNSLMEGKQWNSRACAKFIKQNIKIQRLASDVKKGSAGYTNGSDLISTFATYLGIEGANELPDILIMCNHHKRIEDILNLLETLSGLNSKARDFDFMFNIYFDECDAGVCIGNVSKFISDIYKKNLKRMINEIQFITATPTPDFYYLLKKSCSSITNLINLKHLLKIEAGGTKKRIKDYKTILNQKHIAFEGPDNPIEYIQKLNSNLTDIITQGKIIFAPSGHYTKQHNKMADLSIFKENGFWTLILNGKEKGFRTPLGVKVDITPQLKSNGELSKILAQWRKEHPTASLLITGKQVLERGLTFLTDGFCFDYFIISPYFAKHLSDLVQIFGRGQGNEQHVGKFTVITPQAVYDEVKKYIEDSESILEEEPEYFDEDMLSRLGRGKVSNTKNIEEPHYEKTLSELVKFIHNNCINKKGRRAGVKVKKWENKAKNKDGFIIHSYGETKNTEVKKVWSEKEAIQRVRKLNPRTRRIFPCYTDLNDVSTLKWYVFYRNN